MLLTLFSWSFIGFVLFSLGWGVCLAVEKIGRMPPVRDLDSLLIAGMVAATVHAEIFSLFSKIGCMAVCLLCVLVAVIWFFDHRAMERYWHEWWSRHCKRKWWFWVIIAIFTLFSAFLASETPSGYDSYNYHIPTIRWLEEYGIVKGLGNLHTRFAYNSAFLPLQALFSFAWLLGRSLHGMNAFLWCFVMVSGFGGLSPLRKGIGTSDMLRLLWMVLALGSVHWGGEPAITNSNMTLGAPHTDFMPLALTGWMFVKWCELCEGGRASPAHFGLLALVGVFAVTVKLSAAALVCFGVWALTMLFLSRSWRAIMVLFAGGGIVLAPFVARNILLSGYLVYPAIPLQCSAMDWKVPDITAQSDSLVIRYFARHHGGLDSWPVMQQDAFSHWFPEWFVHLSRIQQLGTVGSALLYGMGLLIWLGRLNKKRIGLFRQQGVLPVVSGIGFLYFILVAPTARFGAWWMYVGPAWGVGFCMERGLAHVRTRRTALWGTLAVRLLFGAIVAVCIGRAIHVPQMVWRMKTAGKWMPNDYWEEPIKRAWMEIGKTNFFYAWDRAGNVQQEAMDGYYGLNGYAGFPGTETRQTLSQIEMRGQKVKDGFRTIHAEDGIAYDFQGNTLSPEEALAILGIETEAGATGLSGTQDSVSTKKSDRPCKIVYCSE